MSTDAHSSEAPPTRRWRPLESIERRVMGVLIEKAKTTPEAYPLSINALRTGCMQDARRIPRPGRGQRDGGAAAPRPER